MTKVLILSLSLLLFAPQVFAAQLSVASFQGTVVTSGESISRAQLETRCKKDTLWESTYTNSANLKLVQTAQNAYSFVTPALSVSIPKPKKLISCAVNLYVEINGETIIGTVLAGSENLMSLEEINALLKDKNALAQSISEKLNPAQLVEAPTISGYKLKLSESL